MEQERLSKLAGITEIETNPGDDIVNSLDTIDEYVEKLFNIKYDDILSDYPKMREIAYRIQKSVDDVRNRLNDLND
tara:strand:+ start:153 stop:380 length:228 start_codon:yes stop_codon:yes gene_type:complete